MSTFIFVYCSKCNGQTTLLPAPSGREAAYAGTTPGECPHCGATDIAWTVGAFRYDALRETRPLMGEQPPWLKNTKKHR